MKKSNVDKDMVNFVMDFVEDDQVTFETVEAIYESVGRHLRKVDLKENKKLLKGLKEGEVVSFLDRRGNKHKGTLIRKETGKGEVIVDLVDNKNQVWRVAGKFLIQKKRKK